MERHTYHRRFTSKVLVENGPAFSGNQNVFHLLLLMIIIIFWGPACNENGDDPPYCDEGFSMCDGVCVDTGTDPEHCGGCFNSCRSEHICYRSACIPDCPEDQSLCGNSCADLSSDPFNCGQCGIQCQEGEVCSGYQCRLSCSGGLIMCNGTCVDTTEDPDNCGSCGNACPPGSLCEDSVCTGQCSSGMTLCGVECVDLRTDPQNCGACGERCSDGRVCVNASCELSCSDPMTDCGGECVNTGTNREHCGGCFNPCTEGHECIGGSCIYECQPGDPDCDLEPPGIPRLVRALADSDTVIRVFWSPPEDNTGVAEYRIYRDGIQVGNSVSLSYSDAGLNPATLYSYTVTAVDSPGNSSDHSVAVEESTYAGNRPVRPGHNWVRKYPFTVSALIYSDWHWNPASYLGAGFNASHVWAKAEYPHGHNVLLQSSEQHGLLWHLNIWADSLTQPVLNQIEAVCGSDCTRAFYVYDEPVASQFAGIGEVVSHLKIYRPRSLIYMSTADFDDNYVASLMHHIDPDVLMYCMYPFYSSGTNWNRYYRSIAQKRKHSLQYDIPFFTWIHAFAGDHGGVWRRPSGSEIRMHLYTTLSAGSKGISYFLWDIDELEHIFNYAINLPGGVPTELYHEVSLLNPAIERLGEVLKWLDTVDLRFVPGRNRDNIIVWPNSVPDEIPRWSRGAGGISSITDVDVAAGQYHRRKNGLMGFFEGNGGIPYFMLTNFFCDENLGPQEAAVTFTVKFDSSVDEVYRFNPENGSTEILHPGADGTLSLILPGGTGHLFCLVPGCF